jgi:hypothetical protein
MAAVPNVPPRKLKEKLTLSKPTAVREFVKWNTPISKCEVQNPEVLSLNACRFKSMIPNSLQSGKTRFVCVCYLYTNFSPGTVLWHIDPFLGKRL